MTQTIAIAPAAVTRRLSKSRFTTGLQCHKLLWWTVHEDEAPELEADAALKALFKLGAEVGVEARKDESMSDIERRALRRDLLD